ncbi:hypothetical protein [Corallococcus exiguus]|uniref:hypothetical protein n=1 Tax=Corallococcus exiguus TaxID=83462 RepID=UPI00111F5836|nr:hypothetical protein [Corallococcus exiguus]TNV44608.1 hypothetical protein FH620_43385 [Corallococcus exiguus]
MKKFAKPHAFTESSAADRTPPEVQRQICEHLKAGLLRRVPKLEQQLGKFTGVNGRRDDRADAFCWGVHDLVFAEQFFAV